MPTWDSLWIDGHVATMVDPGAPGAGPAYGAIPRGAVGITAGRIAWVGPEAALPDLPERCASTVHSMAGGWLTPGLIDCHTHLVFAGHRVAEFEARASGATYAEIARRGGGILSTVALTRAAGPGELLAAARDRALTLRAGGVTTLEIKSGYGLDLATERRMLAVARAIGAGTGMDVRTTYLGAHTLPAEYAGRPDDYLDLVCDEVMPVLAAEGLIDAVDAFCESIAFSVPQVERVFRRARELGLPVKLHADQLTDGGGAGLAAKYAALSADHLEYTGPSGVAAMAAAGTVAVLLPAAFYTLHGRQVPPVAELRRRRVPLAVATDCNPGSSPALSLLLAMNMACHLFGLTPEECLAGVTRSAARALGLDRDRGIIAPGFLADLALWKITEPAELSYWLGHSPLVALLKNGSVVNRKSGSDCDFPGEIPV